MKSAEVALQFVAINVNEFTVAWVYAQCRYCGFFNVSESYNRAGPGNYLQMRIRRVIKSVKQCR